MTDRSGTGRMQGCRRREAGPGRVAARLAALVLARATGLPLRSAEALLPRADDQGPYFGI